MVRKALAKASSAVPHFTAWSLSRLNDYRKCPRYACLKHLKKVPEPKNVPLLRGIEIHEAAQRFLNGPTVGEFIPAELEKFKPQFQELKKIDPSLREAEFQLAFADDWKPVEWYSSEAWVRVVFDAVTFEGILIKRQARASARLMRIIDFKTGKERDGYQEQLKLYALAGFMLNANVMTVIAELWYLDSGACKTELFTRGKKKGDFNIDAQCKHWTHETKQMLADRKFSATPSSLCKWCHYRKSNGGPCEHC